MSSLPNELLEQIFDLIAQPLATFTEDDHDAVKSARRTLRTATLVSRRWHSLIPRYLERRVHLPWTTSQLESYTSRPRRPAPMMRILITGDALGDAGGHRLVKSVQAVAGVTTLHFMSEKNAVSSGWLADVLRCSSLDGMKELSIVGGFGVQWEDPASPKSRPYGFRLERLAIPLTNSSRYSTEPSAEFIELLFPNDNPSLHFLDLDHADQRPWSIVQTLPPLGISRVRHLSFAPSPGRTALSLSPFHSLTSLSLNWVPSKRKPVWKPTTRILNQLAALSPTATLVRLSLPCGSTANLHLFAERLNFDVALSHLTELRLPNLARTVLESDEPGRAFAVVCKARQIKVLLSEDLGGVTDEM